MGISRRDVSRKGENGSHRRPRSVPDPPTPAAHSRGHPLGRGLGEPGAGPGALGADPGLVVRGHSGDGRDLDRAAPRGVRHPAGTVPPAATADPAARSHCHAGSSGDHAPGRRLRQPRQPVPLRVLSDDPGGRRPIQPPAGPRGLHRNDRDHYLPLDPGGTSRGAPHAGIPPRRVHRRRIPPRVVLRHPRPGAAGRPGTDAVGGAAGSAVTGSHREAGGPAA